MSFEMKFEALQPIGYGDYESGLAEGIKQGIEQGKFLGLQQGVSQTNAEVLVLTGTEKPTATQAIAEINITLATNLISKGVIALPDQTTETLAGKVADIRNPQDAYAEGVAKGVQTTNTDVLSVIGTSQHTAVEAVTEVNATLASILTDKGVEADASETTEALVGKVSEIKAAEPWIYGWARNCVIAGNFTPDTEFGELGDLHFDNATTLNYEMFLGNLSLTKVGNITALKDVSLQYGKLFEKCTNLTSVGDITINLGGRYKALASLFRNCSALKTVGFIDAPLADEIIFLFYNCSSLETCGGFNSGAWHYGTSVFNGCKVLREITHPIDFTSCTGASETFRYCTALEEMRWVANSVNCNMSNTYLWDCPNLSNATIQSMVDGLKDRTGETAYTLTLHTSIEARMSETQKATATAKNWTLAFRT